MRSQRLESTPVPSARSNGLLIEHVGNETVVYDTETKQAHCLKPLASVVFEYADGQGSVAELAATAERELGEPVESAQVADAAAQLETLGLLDVPMVVQNGNGVSRREAIRRIGFAGAAVTATTLVTSIVAPTAAMAQSGIPTGCTGCGKNNDCISNHCCQDVSGKQCNQSCCVGANNSCHITTGGTCTVTVADSGCGACPCSQCPPGSVICCS